MILHTFVEHNLSKRQNKNASFKKKYEKILFNCGTQETFPCFIIFLIYNNFFKKILLIITNVYKISRINCVNRNENRKVKQLKRSSNNFDGNAINTVTVDIAEFISSLHSEDFSFLLIQRNSQNMNIFFTDD